MVSTVADTEGEENQMARSSAYREQQTVKVETQEDRWWQEQGQERILAEHLNGL